MKLLVILSYKALQVAYETDADSVEDADFEWTVGPYSCDCVRSQILQAAGVLKEELACNREGQHQVALVSIQPFHVM